MTKTVKVGCVQRVGGWCEQTVFSLQTHPFRAGGLEPIPWMKVETPVDAA